MTRYKLILKYCSVLMSALLLIGGCEINRGEESETEELIPVIATLPPVEEEPLPYPVTVNDVRIDAAPKRVVSLSPSLTEILCEMGYGSTVVGRGSYCDTPAEIAALPDVGRPAKPDYDLILSLSPDVLFTATAIPVKDKYRLEESGIKTVYLPYPHTVGEFEKIYCVVGMIYEGLFDGEEKGTEGFSELKQALEDTSRFSLGSFVYLTEGLSPATGDTFESAVLSRFGENAAAEGENYSFPTEALLEAQPEWILLNSSYTKEDLLSDEVYASLGAVQNGKVLLIDNSYFERPSLRLTELLDSLAEQLGESGAAEEEHGDAEE